VAKEARVCDKVFHHDLSIIGWQDSEILRYRWNPMVKRYCDDMSQDSLPLFTIMVYTLWSTFIDR
jgi:hypothetical protein